MGKINNLENILLSLKYINDKYNELEKLSGIKFNIFSILNMEKNEVKTHSNFIFELLNQNGSHGFNNVFQKLFFDVLKLEWDNDFVKVVQEELIKDNRRIDFTMSSNSYNIGIEMKIDALDQDKQLFDYYQALKNTNKKIKLYYLTLDGKKPSKKSLNGLDTDKYILISFEKEILEWIELCIKESANNTTVREALMQYRNLINKITNKSQSEGRIMEYVELFQKNDSLKIYLEAEEGVKKSKINLQLKFWKKLKEKLKDVNLEFDYNFELIKSKKNTIDEAVNNYYEKSQSNQDYGLNLYLEKDIFIFISIQEHISIEVGHDSSDIYNQQIKELNINWKNKDSTDSCWKFTEKKLNFRNLLENDTVDLMHDEILDNNIDSVVNEVNSIIGEVKKIF